MNYTRRVSLLAFAMLSMVCAGNAKADLVLEFSIDGGSTFGDSFVVENDSTSTLSVFLSETAPDTVLSDDGLLGFGLRGSLASGSGSITSGNIDPVFDFTNTEEFTATSLAWEGLVFNNTVPQGSRILLGQFDYQLAGDETSVFEFVDFTPGSGSANANWLTGGGAELDEAIFGAGSPGVFQLTLSTSAIPEPASATMLAAASLVLIIRRRRELIA